MVEPGQLYRPASHEQCRLFGAPESGQSTAVWYNGQELIGLFQTCLLYTSPSPRD